MIQPVRWGVALAMLSIAACSSTTPTVTTPPAPVVTLSDADSTFANSVAMADMFQTQASALAAQKARRPAVKTYAAQLGDAYGKNMSQMQTTVSAKGVSMGSTMDPARASDLAKLQGLSGAAFDRAYLSAEVAALRQSVSAYQAEIASGTDADLKALAQTNLPTVQRQLARARALGGR